MDAEHVLGFAAGLVDDLDEVRFNTFANQNADFTQSKFGHEDPSHWVKDYANLMSDDWIQKYGTERLSLLSILLPFIQGMLRQYHFLRVCPKCGNFAINAEWFLMIKGGRLTQTTVVNNPEEQRHNITAHCDTCDYVLGEADYFPPRGGFFLPGDLR